MTDSTVSWFERRRGVPRSQPRALLSRTGSGTTSGQGEERLRPSADAPSPSWSFWNMDVRRCWSSVPAASRAAGGDTGTASRGGGGGQPCSSRQVRGAWARGPRAHVQTPRDPGSLETPYAKAVSQPQDTDGTTLWYTGVRILISVSSVQWKPGDTTNKGAL